MTDDGIRHGYMHYPFLCSLELNTRILNALAYAKCTTKELFLGYTKSDFMCLPNIGRLSVAALLAEQRRVAGIVPEPAVVDTKRADALTTALVKAVHEYGRGMSLATALGCLRIVEHALLTNDDEDSSVRDNDDYRA